MANKLDYIAGAVVAFSFVLIIYQIIGFTISGWDSERISAMEFFLGIIQLIAHVIGGFFAGYLIGKKLESDQIIGGATTGLLAYILESIYISLFGGSFMPEFWSLGGFLIFGAAGAYIVKRNQLKTENNKEKKHNEDLK
jgi:hypothetical protein